MKLMVDTGASLVVLPASTAGALGLQPDQLAEQTLQTAKGELQARVGRIKAVQLGDARVEDVDVALVDDEQLGGMALLGMNVLSRYLFILDDEKNQLILIPQEKKP
jgi:clan AA aspartic protease (TIGR02281 family)